MNRHIRLLGLWFLPALLLAFPVLARGQSPAEAGVQVLTQGPIHEAFAEYTQDGGVPSVIITRRPPEAISEVPPSQRPAGDNVAWIPGYWSWDDDRTDFIWLSGVWRDIPPGRQWVPGYWTSVNSGAQWIPGFWGDDAQTEIVYLPAPPQSLERGPNSPLPTPNSFWTPGCWVWTQSNYAWQPGYWVVQQPEWVWAPAHYTWTPRGQIYVAGYWDRDLVHRGIMFAPVYYQQPLYTRSTYVYTPSIVIDIAVVAAFLFVQPRSHHYYYGDYYDRRYEDRGFQPWYANHDSRYGYDSMYAQYRSRQLTRDPYWDKHVVEQFRHRRDNENARPPRTFELQVNIFNTQNSATPREFAIGRDLVDVTRSRDYPGRFKTVDTAERERFATHGQDVRKFQMERRESEAASRDAARPESNRSRDDSTDRWQMRRSPVASRQGAESGRSDSPPPPPNMPTPEPRAHNGKQKPSSGPEARSAPERREGGPNRVEGSRTKASDPPMRAKDERQRTSGKPAPADDRSSSKHDTGRATTESKPSESGSRSAARPQSEASSDNPPSGHGSKSTKRMSSTPEEHNEKDRGNAKVKKTPGKRGGSSGTEGQRKKKGSRH